MHLGLHVAARAPKKRLLRHTRIMSPYLISASHNSGITLNAFSRVDSAGATITALASQPLFRSTQPSSSDSTVGRDNEAVSLRHTGKLSPNLPSPNLSRRIFSALVRGFRLQRLLIIRVKETNRLIARPTDCLVLLMLPRSPKNVSNATDIGTVGLKTINGLRQ